MRHSPDYVLQYLDFLQEQPIKRVLLPEHWVFDTLRSLSFLHQLLHRYPSLHFDFHAHNDYDLGTAMCWRP
jgi:D-citramalate synthase